MIEQMNSLGNFRTLTQSEMLSILSAEKVSFRYIFSPAALCASFAASSEFSAVAPMYRA